MPPMPPSAHDERRKTAAWFPEALDVHDLYQNKQDMIMNNNNNHFQRSWRFMIYIRTSRI